MQVGSGRILRLPGVSAPTLLEAILSNGPGYAPVTHLSDPALKDTAQKRGQEELSVIMVKMLKLESHENV